MSEELLRTGALLTPANLPQPRQRRRFGIGMRAVLLRNLERLEEQGRRDALDQMALLLTHTEERIRAVAAKRWRDWQRT